MRRRVPRRLASDLLALPLALLAAGLSCACGGDAADAGPVAVAAGAVSVAPVGESPPPDERLFAESARAMIAGLPRFPAPAVSGGAPRIDVTGAWELADGEAALRLEARLKDVAARAPVRATVVATGPAQDAAAAAGIVRRGMADLGKALAALFALSGAGEPGWARALDAAEPDEQVLALALLADAKSRAAVPAIGRLLADPRERVAEAAADALVAIGDRAAVPILIAGIRRGDVRSEVRAIEAISRLGGKEARAYLEMTAIGHEIPEVRALSQSALERLAQTERRAP